MNRVCSLLLIITVSVLTAFAHPVQTQEARTISLTDQAKLEALLDPIFAEQMRRLHIPGAVIVVVKDGRILFTKGYGFANVERRTPVVPDRTIFRIGSISKVFAATAVMQLADRGRINLNDDVNRYLQDIRVPNTYPQPVTFANLLTHTSGLDEINLGRKTSSPDRVIPLGQFLRTRLIRRMPPGEIISYSTYGITLAGYAVQSVSGIDFRDYLNRNIFRPLGMNRTSITAVPSQLQSDLAAGYEYAGNNYHPLGFEYFHTYPASDVNSTATDMARFMLAHLEGGRYGRGRILSGGAARQMHGRQFANHPRLLGMTYGFFESRRNGVRAVEHDGSMDGFSALLYMAPEQRLGIFVACNREVNGLQDRVRNAILNHYFPVRQDAETVRRQATQIRERLDRFAGRYRADYYCHTCAEGARGYVPPAFDITANDEGTLSFWGGRWRQVEPLLFQLVSGQLDNGEVVVAFREGRSGQITHMLNGIYAHERLPRETSPQPATVNLDPQILNAYVGQYQIAPNRLVTITLEDGRLMGEMTGQPKVELSPTSETRFIVREAEAEVNFVRDEQGRITHLILRLNGQEMQARRIR